MLRWLLLVVVVYLFGSALELRAFVLAFGLAQLAPKECRQVLLESPRVLML